MCLEGQHLADIVLHAQTFQGAGGDNSSVYLAVANLADTLLYATTDTNNLQVRTQGKQFTTTHGGTGSYAAACRQLRQRQVFSAYQRIALVKRREQGYHLQTVIQRIGQVLGRVDCDISMSTDECLVQFTGKHISRSLAIEQ